MRLLGCAALGVGAATGCGDFDRNVEEPSPYGALTAGDDDDNDREGTTGESDAAESDSGDLDDELSFDLGAIPDTPTGVGGECPTIVAASQPTVRPADIILAVDTSGSMWEEAQAVVDNLNAFSAQIVESGVDARVVLIAEPPSHGGPCIAPPLGSGNCPEEDDNPPLFTHIDEVVYSTDALHRIVWDFSQYEELLRPGSVRHIVVVSDDNSEIPAAEFETDFVASDDGNADYSLHAIVCEAMCPEAQAVGSVYIDLATKTGGTVADLCEQDFQPVFDQLSAQVVANAIPCEYTLPETAGGPHDAETATVEIDLGDGPFAVDPVYSAADCGGVQEGWYFDDPSEPTSVVFCADTCEQLRDDLDATVEISLTCLAPQG